MTFLPIIDNGGGMIRADYAACLLHAMSNRNIEWSRIGYPYPDGSRNIATHEFLESKCDKMFFIDTDIIFDRKHVDMILSHDEPIVAGLYPKKKRGLELVVSTEKRFAQDPNKEGVDPLVRVDWVGTGFMCIRRDVFEAMEHESPEFELEGQKMREYWRCLPGGHSEDREFCEHFRALGGAVYVDQRVTLKHEGIAIYPIAGTF